jgi:hypothetical protein
VPRVEHGVRGSNEIADLEQIVRNGSPSGDRKATIDELRATTFDSCRELGVVERQGDEGGASRSVVPHLKRRFDDTGREATGIRFEDDATEHVNTQFAEFAHCQRRHPRTVREEVHEPDRSHLGCGGLPNCLEYGDRSIVDVRAAMDVRIDCALQ